MEFGLVDFQQHLDSAGGGCSYVGNVVSESGRYIFGINVGVWIHGGKKGWEEFY